MSFLDFLATLTTARRLCRTASVADGMSFLGDLNGDDGVRSRRTASTNGHSSHGSALRNVELTRDANGFGFGFTVLPSHKGILIRELLPGGAAERDGRLLRGDVVTSVNGVTFDNVSQEEAESLVANAGRMAVLTVSKHIESEQQPRTPVRSSASGIGAVTTTFTEHESKCSRATYMAQTVIKVPIACVATVFLFLGGIIEGFCRVVGHGIGKRFKTGEVQPLKTENVCYEIMMALWHEWILDDPTKVQSCHVMCSHAILCSLLIRYTTCCLVIPSSSTASRLIMLRRGSGRAWNGE